MTNFSFWMDFRHVHFCTDDYHLFWMECCHTHFCTNDCHFFLNGLSSCTFLYEWLPFLFEWIFVMHVSVQMTTISFWMDFRHAHSVQIGIFPGPLPTTSTLIRGCLSFSRNTLLLPLFIVVAVAVLILEVSQPKHISGWFNSDKADACVSVSAPAIGLITDLYINISWIIPPTRLSNRPSKLCGSRPFRVVIVVLSYYLLPPCCLCSYHSSARRFALPL